MSGPPVPLLFMKAQNISMQFENALLYEYANLEQLCRPPFGLISEMKAQWPTSEKLSRQKNERKKKTNL